MRLRKVFPKASINNGVHEFMIYLFHIVFMGNARAGTSPIRASFPVVATILTPQLGQRLSK
jgi:hypothetical protein